MTEEYTTGIWDKLTRIGNILGPVVCLLMSLFAARMLYYEVPYGLGISHDSTIYIEAARNLAVKNEYATGMQGRYQPLTHYPPLYSFVLSVGIRLGFPVEGWARLLNAAMLGMCSLLGGFLAVRLTGHWFLAPLGAFIFGFAGIQHHVFIYVWSEPLFITVSLLGIAAWAEYFRKGQLIWVGLAGLFWGLAMLTRHVGASLVLAAGIFLLILSLRRRALLWREGLAFLSPSCVLLLGWWLRGYLLGVGSTGRTISQHWPSWERIFAGHWINKLDWVLLLLVPLVLLAWFWPRSKEEGKTAPNGSNRLILLLAVYAFCYMLIVYLSAGLFDPNIQFDERMYAPLEYTLPLFAIWALGLPQGKHWIPQLVWVAGIVLCLWWGKKSWEYVRWLQGAIKSDGIGNHAFDSRQRPYVQTVKKLPTNALLLAASGDHVHYRYATEREVWPDSVRTHYLPNPNGPIYYLVWERPCIADGLAEGGIPEGLTLDSTLVPCHVWRLR
jgi:hypothetical protein